MRFPVQRSRTTSGSTQNFRRQHCSPLYSLCLDFVSDLRFSSSECFIIDSPHLRTAPISGSLRLQAALRSEDAFSSSCSRPTSCSPSTYHLVSSLSRPQPTPPPPLVGATVPGPSSIRFVLLGKAPPLCLLSWASGSWVLISTTHLWIRLYTPYGLFNLGHVSRHPGLRLLAYGPSGLCTWSSSEDWTPNTSYDQYKYTAKYIQGFNRRF